jgi:uncharacterized protein YuzE
MNEPRRHQVLSKRLRAVPKYGLPDAGLSVTYSEAKGEVEAAYLWIGATRRPAHDTMARIGGDVLVDLDAQGNFLGLELLRRITRAEAQRFYRWAHKRWQAPTDKPHWPCSAMLSLLNAWLRAERLACPHCRELQERPRETREQAKQRVTEAAKDVVWTPELVAH